MVPGDEPVHVGTFVGSAESVAWSSDGTRLLVLVADPGCYGLDWSARAVNGAEPAADPAILRPGEARRRLFMLDLASGDSAEVGPPDTDIWEVDWDGDGLAVAIASVDPPEGPGGTRRTSSDWTSTRRTARTLYEPTWQIEWLALSPDGTRAVLTEGYASDHGLLNGSVMMVNLVDGATTGSVARTWRRRASPAGSTTTRSGIRGSTGPGRRAGGCGWTDVARSAGAATRSSATR